MPTHKTAECHECGTVKDIRAMYPVTAYDSPFDEVPEVFYVCKTIPKKNKGRNSVLRYYESCEELLTDSSWSDFRYFTCEFCNRFICEQNPHNGWHVQYRIINECEQICLKCYESIMFEQGLELEQLEQGKLPGMFFDENELIEHGFIKVIDFDYIHVCSSRDVKKVCDKGIELMSAGYIVVINYESMAIGGLEGYISLFAKKIEPTS